MMVLNRAYESVPQALNRVRPKANLGGNCETSFCDTLKTAVNVFSFEFVRCKSEAGPSSPPDLVGYLHLDATTAPALF